jgi:hypothetical protein
MALVLDKTYTGITSTTIVSDLTEGTTGITYNFDGWTETIYIEADEILNNPSGYTETTYITGLTMLSYSTKCGCVLTDPYLVIDSILLNKYYSNFIHKFPITIDVCIYRDESARKIELKCPHDEIKYYVEVGSDVYNNYFSTTGGLNEYGVYVQAYKYINTLYLGWKSDEEI